MEASDLSEMCAFLPLQPSTTSFLRVCEYLMRASTLKSGAASPAETSDNVYHFGTVDTYMLLQCAVNDVCSLLTLQNTCAHYENRCVRKRRT
jgi:hypothetical protein